MEGIETLFQSSPTLHSPTLCISCARWKEIPNLAPWKEWPWHCKHTFLQDYTRQRGQNWSLTPISWALPPQGQRLSHWIHLVEVWGLPRTWLYGKWNYEQCFSAGNAGRKSYTKQRVDIIIYIRREFWSEFFLGEISPTDGQKKESPVRPLQRIFIENFQKISYFWENIYIIRRI
jgi:hypothetical protein